MTGGLFDQAAQPFDGDPFGDGISRATMAGRVAAFFKSQPNRWIDGREVMTIAGSYGWRTRISDCRRAPYNMRIDNRQRRVQQYTVSEYMFVPDVAAGAA